MIGTQDYISFIINSHLYEKFYINHYINKKSVNSYNIEKVMISFTMSPELVQTNPFSVLSHIMLLEQFAGQKFTHHLSQRHINEFNLKKHNYIGSSVTLRHNIMYQFLNKLINIYQDNVASLKGFVETCEVQDKSFSLGLTNLDAFEPLFSSFEKWALIPDTYKYGCSISIINSYNNSLVNEIFLSHLNIKTFNN